MMCYLCQNFNNIPSLNVEKTEKQFNYLANKKQFYFTYVHIYKYRLSRKTQKPARLSEQNAEESVTKLMGISSEI